MKVQLLGERLTQADGQDVRIDLIKPTNISWAQWINTQFAECNKWVVFCDAEYKRRVDDPNASFLGGEVSIEYLQMLNELYENRGVNNKIVPIYCLKSKRVDVVPRALRQYTCYGVDIPTEEEEITSSEWDGYTRFYREGPYDLPKGNLGRRPIPPNVPTPSRPFSLWRR
jgi:hypothetical protein